MLQSADVRWVYRCVKLQVHTGCPLLIDVVQSAGKYRDGSSVVVETKEYTFPTSKDMELSIPQGRHLQGVKYFEQSQQRRSVILELIRRCWTGSTEPSADWG